MTSISESANGGSTTAESKISTLRDDAAAFAGTLSNEARQRFEALSAEAQRTAQQTMNSLQTQVREKPGVALGVAAGVGVLVGLLMSRR